MQRAGYPPFFIERNIMSGIVTIKFGEGKKEREFSTNRIMASDTVELSKIKRTQNGIIKKAKTLKAEADRATKELEDIKNGGKGIEDPGYLDKIVAASEGLIELSNEATMEQDNLLLRKATVICSAYGGRFEFNEVMKEKTKEEIGEEFEKLYNFANGIIRKN